MEDKIAKLAPSILAADFARLGEQVIEAVRGGADRIHVDTMDGHFLPNITMGGHQPFIHNTLPKIRRVGQMIERIKPECELEVDGGIDEATAQLTIDAGANVLVAGSSIFATGAGVCAAIQRLCSVVDCGAH